MILCVRGGMGATEKIKAKIGEGEQRPLSLSHLFCLFLVF